MQIALQLTGLTEYKGNHQSQHFCSDNATTWLFIVFIWKVKYHWWNNPTLLLPLNSSRSKSKWRARAPTVKSDRSRKGLFATNVVLLGSSWCCSFSLLSAPEKKKTLFFCTLQTLHQGNLIYPQLTVHKWSIHLLWSNTETFQALSSTFLLG